MGTSVSPWLQAESAPIEEPVMQAIGRSVTATSVSSGATSTLVGRCRSNR
jgi:hypothetical protein